MPRNRAARAGPRWAETPSSGPLRAKTPSSGPLRTKTQRAGTLRAKTGTLPQAVALTGLVTTADGRLLAFTVLANDFESGGAWGVRAAVDEWATELAACGCS